MRKVLAFAGGALGLLGITGPPAAGSSATLVVLATAAGGPIDAAPAVVHLLLPGLVPYGTSTPGCAGPLPIGASSIPQVGNAGFAVTCANAPPSSSGFFGLSLGGLSTPLVLGALAVWINPFSPLFFEVVVPSDAAGNALVPLPIPPNPILAGVQVFTQFAWFDSCAPGGFSASNALAITVQP